MLFNLIGSIVSALYKLRYPVYKLPFFTFMFVSLPSHLAPCQSVHERINAKYDMIPLWQRMKYWARCESFLQLDKKTLFLLRKVVRSKSPNNQQNDRKLPSKIWKNDEGRRDNWIFFGLFGVCYICLIAKTVYDFRPQGLETVPVWQSFAFQGFISIR